MAQRLHSLKAAEVSPVPRGAIDRTFVVLKDADAAEQAKHISKAVESVKSTPPSIIRKIKKVLKSFQKKPDEDGESQPGEGLDPDAQVALEAVGRILAPHKDQITDAHVDAVQEMVGIQGDGGGSDQDPDGEEGDDVKPQDLQKAQEAGLKAYGEELKKLGYQKYPEAELTMKAKKKLPSGEKNEEDDDADGDEEEEDMSKEATQVAKPILKEDGSINLEAVPAEMRPFAEVIAKQHAATSAELKVAKEQNVKLEKQLSDDRASVRKGEIERIAKSFDALDPVFVQTTLEIADAAGKEKFDAVLKGFGAQQAQAKESAIFKTIGSGQSMGGGGTDSEYAKIQKAVEQVVQKSAEAGKPISKAAAEEQYFLNNPEAYTVLKSQRQARPDGA